MTLPSGHSSADDRVEQTVGNLLRVGVLIAAAVAVLGGAVFLWRHGGGHPDYRVFRGEPTDLSTVTGILAGAAQLQSRAVVQLGIILLIATPIARVMLTLVAFAMRRDRMYVLITMVVLALLLFSLFGG